MLQEAAAPRGFADMAVAAGLPRRGCYKVRDVRLVLGVSDFTVRRAIERGPLRAFLPKGATKGAFIDCASIDEWLEEIHVR